MMMQCKGQPGSSSEQYAFMRTLTFKIQNATNTLESCASRHERVNSREAPESFRSDLNVEPLQIVIHFQQQQGVISSSQAEFVGTR